MRLLPAVSLCLGHYLNIFPTLPICTYRLYSWLYFRFLHRICLLPSILHWYLSSYFHDLHTSMTHTLTGDRAFRSSAPRLWNNLAANRFIPNLVSLKKNLKTLPPLADLVRIFIMNPSLKPCLSEFYFCQKMTLIYISVSSYLQIRNMGVKKVCPKCQLKPDVTLDPV